MDILLNSATVMLTKFETNECEFIHYSVSESSIRFWYVSVCEVGLNHLLHSPSNSIDNRAVLELT